MSEVRKHAFAAAVVALAVAGVGLSLTVWRPRFQPSTQRVPSVRLPYTRAQFTVTDAKRAFAAVGIRLTPKSRVAGVVTTIGTQNDEFVVDVFGDPAQVNALGGSPEVITDTRGKYVRIPSTCKQGVPDAERWRGNVRFVIRCTDRQSARLLTVGALALAKL